MVSVVNLSGNQNIDGVLWGWKYDAGDPFTYSFPTSTAEYSAYAAVNGFQAFNAAQQTAVRYTFGLLASYIPRTFTETTADFARFRFAEASTINYTNDPNVARFTGLHQLGNSGTAEATPPELAFGGLAPTTPAFAQGDSWYTSGIYETPSLGTFSLQAGIMHETGHNMGLKHGHASQSGHGVTFPALPTDRDSYEFSIMTYRQFVGDPPNSDTAPHHATTYQINDIAALQYLYGANFATNSGGTTYSWNNTTGEYFINGVSQGRPSTGNYVLMSIWDGGGADTYFLGNFTSNLTIDLRPGGGGIIMPGLAANLGEGQFARASVYNAYLYNGNTASLIENAYGGTGSDAIYGNQAANYLYGGAGGDSLVGNDGTDQLAGEAGVDYIYGGNDGDAISGGLDGDNLSGDGGNDYILGENGNDAIAGGAGSDVIDGGDNNDTLWGHDPSGAGDAGDLINGGNGDDIIVGHVGGDRLYGGAGQDTISGGNDGDVIYGESGNDNLYGGAGGDAFVFATFGFGADNIWDFTPGQDKIYMSTALFANFAAVQAAAVGGPGVTVITQPGGGGQIALQGFGLSALSANDFTFF